MEISYGDLILESLLSDFIEASAIKSPFERETEFLPIKTNLLIAKKRIRENNSVSIGLLNGHSRKCSGILWNLWVHFWRIKMLRIVCFLSTFLLILPLQAEELDFVNKLILKITDSSASKEVDKIQFEILSYSHGVAMPLTSEGPSYRPVYQDYTIAKYLDLHSSYWLERCARGETISEVALTYYQKSKNGPSTYKALEVQLTNVVVTSVSTNGGTGDRPIETITLSFDSIRHSVTTQGSTGKLETKTFVGKVSKN
ncbi:PF05638 family protein [Leptospira santarosai str. HAI821]|nr:PF05638 family protein [Leptospira santarosai str. HAI821]